MDRTKSPQKLELEWQHFQLNFSLPPTIKEEVLAVIKEKMTEAVQTLGLPEAGLEAVCSPYFSADIYLKQQMQSIIPIKLGVGEAVSITANNGSTTQARLISATSVRVARSTDTHDSDETITYRGAVKDPPPTPDPLLP